MILPYRDRTIIENFKQSLNLAQFCSHIIIAHSHPNFLPTFSFHISCNQPSHTNRICAPNNNLNTARTTHICTSQQYIPQHHYIKTHSNPTHVILYLKTRKGSFISFSFFGRRRCNLCVNKLLHILKQECGRRSSVYGQQQSLFDTTLADGSSRVSRIQAFLCFIEIKNQRRLLAEADLVCPRLQIMLKCSSFGA